MSFSRSTSTLPPPVNYRQDCISAASKRYKYLRRIIMFKQMDFEFALWQMFYLFIAPQKVYRNFQYRKQTKSQFARDDPAFLVLLGGCLCVSSVGFALVLSLGFWQFIRFLLYVIFVDCIGAGLIVATFFWFITNRYFRETKIDSSDVEWGFTFDVHLNAFFPPLLILHGCQLFFYHSLINNNWFISRLIGNTFWFVAIAYYIYITFLGYSSLSILRKTHVILFLLPILFVFYVITLITSWNISHTVMEFYRHRVV